MGAEFGVISRWIGGADSGSVRLWPSPGAPPILAPERDALTRLQRP
jgi:hypothetical protein